jgi:hypothetical protein
MREDYHFCDVNKSGKYVRICGVKRRKPGFPLQFLSPPLAGLRDFRCNPLRAQGGIEIEQYLTSSTSSTFSTWRLNF